MTDDTQAAFWRDRRVFVTGGTGLVGGWLVERLAGLGGRTKVRWKTLLEAAGRHSLAIYLIHQPVLIALVYGVSLVVPPPAADPAVSYIRSCTRACEPEPPCDWRNRTSCPVFVFQYLANAVLTATYSSRVGSYETLRNCVCADAPVASTAMSAVMKMIRFMAGL